MGVFSYVEVEEFEVEEFEVVCAAHKKLPASRDFLVVERAVVNRGEIFMTKAMYILWPDFEYINQAVDAGINTLMIALYNVRPEIWQSEFFGTYESVVETLKECRKLPVRIILVPTWYQGWWTHIPQEHQFFDGKKYYERTPCPTSNFHIDWVMEYPIKLFKEGLCDGIWWDFEDYGWKRHPERLGYYADDNSKEDLQCKCPRCKEFGEIEQRKINSNMIYKKLEKANIPINGQLLHSNGYLWNAFPDKRWWLNEYTYEKSCFWKRLKVHWLNKLYYKVTAKESCGAWIEHFKASSYLKYLKQIGKSALSDGYWIYPQMRLSKYSPFHNPPDWWGGVPFTKLIDDPEDPAGDPEFFVKLKQINKKIDKYRIGIWFKIKRFFVNMVK